LSGTACLTYVGFVLIDPRQIMLQMHFGPP